MLFRDYRIDYNTNTKIYNDTNIATALPKNGNLLSIFDIFALSKDANI